MNKQGKQLACKKWQQIDKNKFYKMVLSKWNDECALKLRCSIDMQ
jgi:hypothetical protein